MERSRSDLSLACVLGAIWLLSVARVALALRSGEAFGVEATLAMLFSVVVPFAIRSSVF